MKIRKGSNRRKNKIRRPSIRFYLVMMNLLLLCLLFPTASLLYMNQEAKLHDIQLQRTIRQMRQALESKSGALVRNMALSAGYAVAGFDFTFLNNMVRQVAAEDTDIRYCLIMDANGMAVAHSDPEKVGATLTGAGDRTAVEMLTHSFPATLSEADRPPVRFVDGTIGPANGAPLMEALTPIYSGAKRYAVLRCGFSLEKLSAEIRATQRDWAERSRQFKVFLVFTTSLLLAIGILITALFTRAFVRSVSTVSNGVNRVAQGNLDHMIQPDRLVCLELLELSEAFNAMTGQLRESRRLLDEYSKSLEEKVAERTRELKDAQAHLMQQAHEAGMAEMAVGILHNIGNAITPAKVELFRLSNRMKQQPLLRNLPAALTEIEAVVPSVSTLSEERKKRLLTIMTLVPAALSEEYALNLDEIEQVRQKLSHIENIIGLQMRYARLFGEIDSVDVTQVVADALTLLDDALKKRSVRVIKNFTQVPPVKIEKTQLIQVVVNLIKNGYEAMEEVDVKERTLALSIHRESGPPDQIVLSIKDNGIGFAPEERHNLFRFGYTTKAKGSGFGLHASANYLIARGGALIAHSDGRGKGAEFVMHLAVDIPGKFHGGE